MHAVVVGATDRETLHKFVTRNTAKNAVIYTDETAVYKDMPRKHESVRHSRGEYVRGNAHTNGIESFWSMLKRAHKGVYHKMSGKHLHKYVDEFQGRHNARGKNTEQRMAGIIRAGVGKQL